MSTHETTTQKSAPLKKYMDQRQTESSDVSPFEDAADYMIRYARQKPEMAALWCFGIGFVLGWKLKPW